MADRDDCASSKTVFWRGACQKLMQRQQPWGNVTSARLRMCDEGSRERQYQHSIGA